MAVNLSIIIGVLGIFFVFLNNTRNAFSFISVGYILAIPGILLSDAVTAEILILSYFFVSLGGYSFIKIKNVKIKRMVEIARVGTFQLDHNTIDKLLFVSYFLGVVCIVLAIYYYSVIGIPILSEDVGQARLEFKRNIVGGFFFERIIRIFLPVIVFIIYMVRLNMKTVEYINYKHISSILLVIFSIFAIAFLLFTGMKANAVTFIILPFIFLYSTYLKKISFGFLLVLVLAGASSLGLMIHLMMPMHDFYEMVSFFWFRLGSGATDGLSYIVGEMVPVNGFTYGQTFLNDVMSLFSKLGLIDIPYKTLGQEIANNLLGKSYNGEQAAVTFSGELYLNFGYWGVCFLSFIIGIAIQIIYIQSLKLRKDIVNLAFLVAFQNGLYMLSGGPVMSMLLDYFVTIVIFILIFRFTLFVFKIISLMRKRPIQLNCTATDLEANNVGVVNG